MNGFTGDIKTLQCYIKKEAKKNLERTNRWRNVPFGSEKGIIPEKAWDWEMLYSYEMDCIDSGMGLQCTEYEVEVGHLEVKEQVSEPITD